MEIATAYEKEFGAPMDAALERRIGAARSAGMTSRIVLSAIFTVGARGGDQEPRAALVELLRKWYKEGWR